MTNSYAEVTAVFPNKATISVEAEKLEEFKDGRNLKIGSYLEITDNDDCKLIAVIESYKITVDDNNKKSFTIEANPLGTLINGEFTRGGDALAIPPTGARAANPDDIAKIYQSSIDEKEKHAKFCFSKLAQDKSIEIPVNGNKFFNKHFAIVGSTGSGKSHTVAKVLQEAIKGKKGEYEGLNNSHIVLFDIHNEYQSAFPDGNYVSENLILPYWLLNSEELEELFLESGDFNNYNQASLLRYIITINKELHNPEHKKVFYDTPIKFDINEILNCLLNLSKETKNYQNSSEITIKSDYKIFNNDSDKIKFYFKKVYEFEKPKGQNFSKGTYADGSLDKFISRLQSKIYDNRLDFLFGDSAKNIKPEDVIKSVIGYKIEDCESSKKSNITILDLGGIPFEVLSITVSLITRLLFDYGYFYKKLLDKENKTCETPLLLVYEEAHKYVPKSDLSKYRASKNAIERIAKEGRKYGVTLGIVSQRPSEISETIFSQCNSFVVMRLTNPEDQSYVKRLLPDTLGNLTDTLPSLQSGEALLIGESIIMPSLVKIDRCKPKPSSSDIKYLEVWQEEWKKVAFENIINEWKK